ncbi:hypothetical protein HGB47_11065 [Leptospira yasudae]|uniref:hypothetical protein n=1 Tax=Leptospira yasudae TaxID=2202201 RepID=UPI001C4E9A04|nr:hypothetical protein [Leptospira yasudae]MBW0434156.1 hypothetical protein [Leptospira yasudae]
MGIDLFRIMPNYFWEPSHVVLLGFFLFLLILQEKYQWNHKVLFGFVGFVSVGLSLYCFGPNLQAKWWLIDDHEVFYLLKSKSNRNGIFDFFNVLFNQTEVGQFGNNPRYRISYYSFRVLEALIFKDNVFLWYFVWFFISTIFVFSIIYFLSKYFSLSVSVLFVLFVFSIRYWSDIFSRLGAGETYAVLGFALILIGFSEYKWKEDNSVWIYVLISIGVLICSGSKENFLPLFLIPLAQLVFEKRTRKSWSRLSVLILPIFLSVFTILSLYLFFKKSSVDIYGNSTRLSDRFSILFGKLENGFVINLLILLLFLLLLYFFEYRKTKKNPVTSVAILPILFLGMLLLNIVFYNGVWPTNSRYDFPGMIFYQGAFFVLIFLLLRRLFGLYEAESRDGNFYLNVVLILFLSSVTSVKGITDLQRDARANMKRTKAFTSFLNDLIADKSDRVLIFYVHQAFDFEPVDAMTRFLNYYGDANDRMIQVAEIKAESDFKNGLLNYMRTISKEGSPDRKVIPFDQNRLKNRSCVLLFFPPATLQDVPDVGGCKELKKNIVPFQ